LLIDQDAWPHVDGRISANDFGRSDHRAIFQAIASLRKDRQAADALTVSNYLEQHRKLEEAGGIAYLATLAKDTPSAENIESYVTAVREDSSRRRLRLFGQKAAEAATSHGRSATDLIADLQQQLQELQSGSRISKGFVDAQELVHEFLDDLDRRSSNPAGLQLGLSDFDALTCGLEPGDLVVMGARPGMGKTSLLVSIASVVSMVCDVAIFSAEMPSVQLIRRYVALLSDVPQGLLRRAEQLKEGQWKSIADAAKEIASRRFCIDQTSAPALNYVRAQTVALKSRRPIGLVLIDYVQLVRGAGDNRYEQLRDVAYGLKDLAKELAVPIIVLAQLNREVDKRENKRPYISDLRDCGAIEEAADIIGLLYCEGQYNGNFGMPYVLECQGEKNRNHERGECIWRFEAANSRVTVLDSGAVAQYRKLRAMPHQRGGFEP
jgi:replicative DNA helicase